MSGLRAEENGRAAVTFLGSSQGIQVVAELNHLDDKVGKPCEEERTGDRGTKMRLEGGGGRGLQHAVARQQGPLPFDRPAKILDMCSSSRLSAAAWLLLAASAAADDSVLGVRRCLHREEINVGGDMHHHRERRDRVAGGVQLTFWARAVVSRFSMRVRT